MHPDCYGVVRTVTVAFKKKDVREPALPYVPRALQELQLGIQRIAIVSPIEDQVGNATTVENEKVTDVCVGDDEDTGARDVFDVGARNVLEDGARKVMMIRDRNAATVHGAEDVVADGARVVNADDVTDGARDVNGGAVGATAVG